MTRTIRLALAAALLALAVPAAAEPATSFRDVTPHMAPKGDVLIGLETPFPGLSKKCNQAAQAAALKSLDGVEDTLAEFAAAFKRDVYTTRAVRGAYNAADLATGRELFKKKGACTAAEREVITKTINGLYGVGLDGPPAYIEWK